MKRYFQVQKHEIIECSCLYHVHVTVMDVFYLVSQDGDDTSSVLTSCDIVKVPDPQMGMVRGHTLKMIPY